MMELKIPRKPPAQLLVLLVSLVLFLIANAVLRDSALGFVPPLLAALVVVEIFVFVGLEVKEGAQKHGWKHEVVDTIIALLVAVAIWYGASFVLNTSSPISGVVSCSMLPNLQRGDFVIVQGADVKSYEIEMTKEELDSLSGRSTVFYSESGQADVSNASIEGSVFVYCLRANDTLCSVFRNSPENLVEKKGPFEYRYAACPISFSNGNSLYESCLESVTFRGRKYLTNFSNDVIVYQPPAGDLYSYVGDIVHRVMFKADVEGKTYYITRGDNNPLLDIQVYDYGNGLTNHPVPQENVRGRVIARIPLLGYFKLFISGYFNEDAQCRTQLTFEHVQ